MRLLRLLIVALACSLLACVPAAVASPTGEVLTVSATSSSPVLSEDLNPSHAYRIAISGVIGAHKGQTAEYDALYCFGPCKPPQPAAALRAAESGQGLTSGVNLLPGADSSGGTLRFKHEFVGILTKDAEITIATSKDRAAFQVLKLAKGTVVQLLGTVTKTTLKGCRVGSSAQIVLTHGKRGLADSVALNACGDQLVYRHSPKDLSKVVVQIK